MASAAQLPSGPTFDRLQDQISYYSSKSRSARKTFKRIKVIEILAAALIPFLGSLPSTWLQLHLALVTGGLGVLITILEGILHLNQYQETWTSYRSTSEALKCEKFLFLGNAGPYAGAAKPESLLAERVETVLSQEHTQWNSLQQQAAKSSSSNNQAQH